MELKQTQAEGFSILQRLLPRFHHELTLNGDVVVQQQRLLMYPCANYTMSSSQYCSKLLLLETIRNAANLSISTVHTWHGRCWFSAPPTSTPAMLPGHLSSLKCPVVWRTALFLLTAGTGRGDVHFFHSFITFSFSEWRWKSQGRDFDDADPGWARGGLDAWRCGVAQESGRSPLHGPVEAVPIRAQIWGCREADDRRGDPAAFAIDPVAVIQLEVQAGTARQTKV